MPQRANMRGTGGRPGTVYTSRPRPPDSRRYRVDRRRYWAAAGGVLVLLALLVVTAPGRRSADRTPLVPDIPPAAGSSAPGAEAAGAAARRGGGIPTEPAEPGGTGGGAEGGDDPPFEPAVAPTPGAPTPGVATPLVARLPLGSFEQPAAGVQAQAGVPRGIPVDDSVRGARRAKETRTLAVRRVDTHVFSAAGVTWRGSASEPVSVALRSHVPRKGWTSWRAVGAAGADREPDRSAGDPVRSGRDPAAADRREPAPVWRQGTDLVWLGTADGIEIVVTGARDRGVGDLVVDLIDPVTAPGDATAGTPPTATPAPGRVPMPAVARRSEWGADERLMTWAPAYAGPIRTVAVDDTGTDNRYTPVDVPRILRALYYHHAVARGWGDLGYSAVVDRFGRIWEGRYGGLSRPVTAAVSGGGNRFTAGVGVLGDHRDAPVPKPAIEACARYVAWKLSLGPAADPRGTVAVDGDTRPRVFAAGRPAGLAGRSKGAAALGAIRESAHRLMGAWADPATVRSRLAVWRPADATWRIAGTAGPALTGAPGDLPVAADFDGDGSADPAIWSPGSGVWQIWNSGGGTGEQYVLGTAGDLPAPADYNGDGRAEPAVFRPVDASWLLGAGPAVRWGQLGDVPVPADYDGDGNAEPAVFRPADGTWYVRGGGQYRLGESFHVPLPGDYDGDGDVEPAAWSPVTRRWFVWGRQPVRFGDPGDVPVPGQYDGDGRADLAVWRSGRWMIRDRGSFEFGQPGDVPIVLV